MNTRRTVFTLCVGILVLSAASVCQALIDLKRIDEVVKKSTLTQEDLRAIDEFMADAVQDMVGATDFSDVSKIRAIILKYQQSTQAQYVKQYSDAAYKQVEQGLKVSKDTLDPVKRSRIATNLLILTDALKDPRLVDLAVQEIQDKDSPARYWAVRTCTDPELWTKISQNPATATQLTTRILTECSQVAQSSAPEVLSLMSSFAGRSNTAAGDDLLTRIADVRIKQYADWTVTYELADVTILGQLADRIAANSPAKSPLAKRFAQLYSFAIRRYIKTQDLNLLQDQSKNYLVSVLIETEDKSLSKLLGAPQGAIRKAVETNDLKALQTEHDRLLGASGKPGELPAKFSFTYGPEGQNLPAPQPLPDPPIRRTPPAAPRS